MAKNKQLNLIASAKILNIGFINQYLINSGIGEGAIQNELITNHFSQTFFQWTPPNYYSLQNIDEID